MKKITLVIAGILIISIVAFFLYLFRDTLPFKIGENNRSNWHYEKMITEPITAVSKEGEDVSLGDISANKVSVVVSGGAFDQETEVQLFNPDSVPKVNLDEVNTIGAPIELTIGEPTRLNEKATVTFAFDKNLLPENTQAYQMRVAYYNGKEWDYIKPNEIDMEAGTMTFETYHFSLFGANRISDDKKITEQWIHSQALDNKLKGDFNDMSDEMAGKVIDLILEKMGISDKSIKGQVLADVLKDDSYKEMYEMYQKGDTVGFSQKIALKAGGAIASIVPESAMQGALADISGDATEDVAKVAQAAGYMAEGQYKEAAKIIGEQIADKFLITTAGKIAVEVVDYQIQSWKNSEIEAAYKAYRDGADGYFYGYNNDPDDFNTVWDQMRGIRRQLELEAIKKENDVRKDAGMPELSERQMDIIRDNVKRTFKTQFKNRKEQEAILTAEEEKLKKIIEAFEKADFFGGIGPKGLDKGYDLETKLDLVNAFVKKMMKDTNRLEFTEKAGYLANDKIQLDELVIGGKFYFSEPDGKKKYKEYLQEHFGISLYPKLDELSGKWSGSFVVNELVYPPEWKDSDKKLDEEGCEGMTGAAVVAALEGMKGKEMPITMVVSPSSDAGGTMTITLNDDDKNVPFTYANGMIKATFTENKAVATISLIPTKNGDSFSAGGSMNMHMGEQTKIEGSVSINKQ